MSSGTLGFMISDVGISGLKIVKDDISKIPIVVASEIPRAKRLLAVLCNFPKANLERLKEIRKQTITAIRPNKVIWLVNTAKRRKIKTAPTIPKRTASKSRSQPNINRAVFLKPKLTPFM
jgi:hypothetical protein